MKLNRIYSMNYLQNNEFYQLIKSKIANTYEFLSLNLLCYINSKINKYLSKLTNVYGLFLVGDYITDNILQYLSNICDLILCKCNNITDSGLVYLSNICSLCIINCNNITNSGLIYLSNVYLLYIINCKNMTNSELVYSINKKLII